MTPLQAAAPFVGVPYRLRGRTLDGWDCWGCVRHARAAIFGLDSPDWSEAYAATDGVTADTLAETTERLVRERIVAWTAVEPEPSAVALMSIFGRRAHVGLMLTDDEMLHAFGRAATVVERISSPRWKGRLVGCFQHGSRP